MHEYSNKNSEAQQWQLIEEHYRNGKLLAVQVYVSHPADIFHSGQEVVVKLEHIDDNKKVVLSLVEAR